VSSLSDETLEPRGRDASGGGPASVVAGYLSAFAIFFSAIGVVWHPLRLIPVSLVLALVAVGLGGPRRRLTLAAVLICAACFFVGMVIAVALSKPLW
jgi:hypothetical protein